MNHHPHAALAPETGAISLKDPVCGMTVEPDYKQAYWCLVEVGLETQNGKIAVEGLKAYEKAFSTEFDLDKLACLDPYKEIARTPEFAAWRKSRR